MKEWRNDKATEKQRNYIIKMQEFSPYPLPAFKGETKGEAYDYIQKYYGESHERDWAIVNGNTRQSHMYYDGFVKSSWRNGGKLTSNAHRRFCGGNVDGYVDGNS